MSKEMYRQVFNAGAKVGMEALRDGIINTCKKLRKDPTIEIIELIANNAINSVELKLLQMEKGADIIKALDKEMLSDMNENGEEL